MGTSLFVDLDGMGYLKISFPLTLTLSLGEREQPSGVWWKIV
jgi:hypothetical protein